MISISEDVLADEIVADSINGYSKEGNINGENVTFSVEKK